MKIIFMHYYTKNDIFMNLTNKVLINETSNTIKN